MSNFLDKLFCNDQFWGAKWLRWVANSTLSCGGPIPKHVAFIMDGNRRFARKNNQQIAQGHDMGGLKLKQTLEWCYELGVTTVSAFAFSIENFKRSKEEVDHLMELAKDRLIKHIPELSKKTRMRFLGDVTLLPDDLQRIIAEGIERSKHITTCTLNICFGYTSTDEITRAALSLSEGVKNNIILPSDINSELFSLCLDTKDCPAPDIVVRTSGEIRLSDFMLWQSSYSLLYFCDVLWPEFSVLHLYKIILEYQLYHSQLMELRQFALKASKSTSTTTNTTTTTITTTTPDNHHDDEKQKQRIESFLSWKDEQYQQYIQKLLNTPTTLPLYT